MNAQSLLRIVDYEPRHRDAFRALNLEWIERWFVVEDADRAVLDDPEHGILAEGGHILMAELDGESVGCCALLRVTDAMFELAKMAVSPRVQGKGIGVQLGRAAIERARQVGAQRVELVTNSSLATALHVYRKLGFVDVPVGPSDYARADVRMVLELNNGAGAGTERSRPPAG
jgi:putative acetyltransferase